ncbi:MAG: Gar1/Naf1 family protein [Candidatus Hydrothermarchaeales archaeon]
MKPLGKISHFTKSGGVILRSDEIPSMFSTVVTKDSREVGKVHDVFGPSSKPYILIKPFRRFGPKRLSSLKDEMLYELPKRRARREAMKWKIGK